METLSTIVLLASLTLPSTVISGVKIEKKQKSAADLTSGVGWGMNLQIKKEQTVLESRVPILTFTEPQISENSQNELHVQLLQYLQLEDGWDGERSVRPSDDTLQTAIEFTNLIPTIFPLPKAMISSNGEPGLYWDYKDVFTDIQFESLNTFSLFSRDRKTGKEIFKDSIDLLTVDSDWFFANCDSLLGSAEYLEAA